MEEKEKKKEMQESVFISQAFTTYAKETQTHTHSHTHRKKKS